MSSAPCARPRLADWRNSAGTSGSLPVEQNLSIYQSDGFATTIEILNGDGTPYDLTGYSAESQIRQGPADLFPEVTEYFTLTIVLPNEITMSLTPEQTAAFTGDTLWWDLQIVASTGV